MQIIYKYIINILTVINVFLIFIKMTIVSFNANLFDYFHVNQDYLKQI